VMGFAKDECKGRRGKLGLIYAISPSATSFGTELSHKSRNTSTYGNKYRGNGCSCIVGGREGDAL
jgi:hypothetical protein